MQLSEAAALADVFVFRLMFRLYWQSRKPSDEPSSLFYEKKRLLSAFAARKYPAKKRSAGRTVEYTKYLMISALALDTRPGVCSALSGTRCGIYKRRPLSCRSVPFHYSRAEASAEVTLKAFVETAGYRCDTGETAQVVLEAGRIVSPEARTARSESLAVAESDRQWREAIVRRMNAAPVAGRSLPTLGEIEASAGVGVVTTSMRAAWQIAAEAGLMNPEDRKGLFELQHSVIAKELASAKCSQSTRETLVEMQGQYREALFQDC